MRLVDARRDRVAGARPARLIHLAPPKFRDVRNISRRTTVFQKPDPLMSGLRKGASESAGAHNLHSSLTLPARERVAAQESGKACASPSAARVLQRFARGTTSRGSPRCHDDIEAASCPLDAIDDGINSFSIVSIAPRDDEAASI